jgi:hypothetical protein
MNLERILVVSKKMNFPPHVYINIDFLRISRTTVRMTLSLTAVKETLLGLNYEKKINFALRVVRYIAIKYLTKFTFVLQDILLRFIRLADILNYYYYYY